MRPFAIAVNHYPDTREHATFHPVVLVPGALHQHYYVMLNAGRPVGRMPRRTPAEAVRRLAET